MKLKFFLVLILVVLLGGCSLLSQGDEEASFLADASGCDVASSLNKESQTAARSSKKLTPKSRERRKSKRYRKTRLIHSERTARKHSKERKSNILPRGKA